MEPVKPTPVKFEPELKKAIKEYADKNYRGNVSMTIKIATEKLINFVQHGEQKQANDNQL